MWRTLLTPTVSRKRSSPTSVVAIVSRRRSMPAPVRTDTSSTVQTSRARSTRGRRCSTRPEIDFVDHDQPSRARRVDIGAILIAQRRNNRSPRARSAVRPRRCTLHTFTFHHLLGLADTGGVDQRDRDAADVAAFRQQVARRAGDLGDDRAVRADECVEQARLSNVGAADNERPDGLHESRGPDARWRGVRRPAHARRRARRSLPRAR